MRKINKEEAFAMLNGSPSNLVIVEKIDCEKKKHLIPEKKSREEGKEMISNALEIEYKDNDFFGMYILHNEGKVIDTILFAQNT